MRRTQIVRFSAAPLDIPLPVPFETARARRTTAENVLITLELAGGEIATGEVAPAPHVTGETREETLRRLRAFGDSLVGADVARYRALSARFQQAYPLAHAARAGLESALLDGYCRALGTPLYQFFGGAEPVLTTDVTIPIVPPSAAGEAARAAVAGGFQDLKLKVGSGPQDLERALAVAQGAPGTRLRLDGNQGLTPEESLSLVERLLEAGVHVTLLEQPVHRDDLEGLRFVRERSPVPVGVDESVLTPQDAHRVIAAGAADVVNIKLMKAGILGAIEIIGVCRAAGVRLMLGCMLETRLGISVAAHLAAGFGCFEFLDLDGHLLTGDRVATGGFEQAGGRLEITETPGHGVSILTSNTPRG